MYASEHEIKHDEAREYVPHLSLIGKFERQDNLTFTNFFHGRKSYKFWLKQKLLVDLS